MILDTAGSAKTWGGGARRRSLEYAKYMFLCKYNPVTSTAEIIGHCPGKQGGLFAREGNPQRW